MTPFDVFVQHTSNIYHNYFIEKDDNVEKHPNKCDVHGCA